MLGYVLIDSSLDWKILIPGTGLGPSKMQLAMILLSTGYHAAQWTESRAGSSQVPAGKLFLF